MRWYSCCVVAKRSKAPVEKVIEAPKPKGDGPPRPIAVEWGAILGQDRALDVLHGSMASGRIHHAWIFHGPQGVGKFTTAVAFAATLLDPSSKAGKDGRFSSKPGGEIGELLKAGSHPDLHVITKELAAFHPEARIRDSKQISISIDVVRHFLLTPAALAPSVRSASLASKVLIVDEAELLNLPAQNGVLKMLEEPPEGTVLVLVTSSEDLLLPTIRSRCQRVAFAPLDEKEMAAWWKVSGLSAPASQKEWLFGYAGGSPGKLKEAVDAGLFGWHEKVSPMLTATEAGKFVPEMGDTLKDLADGWAKAWVEKRPAASKDAANKAGADRVFQIVSEHLRAGLRASAGRGGDLTGRLRALDHVEEAQRFADTNVNLALVMGNLSAQLSETFKAARGATAR